jgi:hypothetical protein
MARMLKRWESPRKEGRNDKGKGGSARRRQLKKQTQMLRKQLKSKGQISDQGDRPNKSSKQKKESFIALLLFMALRGQALKLLKEKLKVNFYYLLGIISLKASASFLFLSSASACLLLCSNSNFT